MKRDFPARVCYISVLETNVSVRWLTRRLKKKGKQIFKFGEIIETCQAV